MKKRHIAILALLWFASLFLIAQQAYIYSQYVRNVFQVVDPVNYDTQVILGSSATTDSTILEGLSIIAMKPDSGVAGPDLDSILIIIYNGTTAAKDSGYIKLQ